MNPKIDVDLAVALIREPPGYREPLITIGHSHYAHFLYVEHREGVVRLVSQSDDSKLVYDMRPPDSTPVSIRLTYLPESRKLSVTVNREPVIVHPIEVLITAPAEVDIGENRSDLGLTAKRFSGVIRLISKTVE
jgi:hypothetical protein